MNVRMIESVLGRMLLTEAVLLLLPMLVSLLNGEPAAPFVVPVLLLAAVGTLLSIRKPKRTALYAKEGFIVVSLA